MDKPSLTVRPPKPPAQSVSKKNSCVPGCNHKYEILEYPGVNSAGYLFFCIYCLQMEERIYQRSSE